MLGAYLDDTSSANNGIACRFCLRQYVSHGFFDVGILPRLNRHFQDWRVGMLGVEISTPSMSFIDSSSSTMELAADCARNSLH